MGPIYVASGLAFGFLLRGCSAQTCDANSLSRSDSKLCTIASNDFPVGGPEGLKTHAHWEQLQPRKRGWSIHIKSRDMTQKFYDSLDQKKS